jgi:hypothetical protein
MRIRCRWLLTGSRMAMSVRCGRELCSRRSHRGACRLSPLGSGYVYPPRQNLAEVATPKLDHLLQAVAEILGWQDADGISLATIDVKDLLRQLQLHDDKVPNKCSQQTSAVGPRASLPALEALEDKCAALERNMQLGAEALPTAASDIPAGTEGEAARTAAATTLQAVCRGTLVRRLLRARLADAHTTQPSSVETIAWGKQSAAVVTRMDSRYTALEQRMDALVKQQSTFQLNVVEMHQVLSDQVSLDAL